MLSEDIKLGLAVGLIITGLVIPYFKMIDHDELQRRNDENRRRAMERAQQTGSSQKYIVSTNANMSLKRIFNWWGLFGALCFLIGVALFFV